MGDENQNENEQKKEEESEEETERKAMVCDDGRLKSEFYAALDVWAFGCLLFQLRTGKMLFDGETEFLVFREVKMMNFELTQIADAAMKALLEGLLKEKPMERIGARDIGLVKKHAFFVSVQWETLTKLESPPFNELKEAVDKK